MTDTPTTIQLVQSWPLKALIISFLLGIICAVWVFPPAPVTVTLGCEHVNALASANSSWYDGMVFWD